MRWLLALLLMVGGATSAASANSITIGQLQYLGTNAQMISAFKVILDPTGVTSTQLNLFNLTLSVNGSSQSTGPITTPTTLLFVGAPDHPLPACPCAMVGLQLFLSADNKPVSFRLANGTLFTTAGSASFLLVPPTGQRVLEPGNSVPITLTAVPEPGTLVLIGTGLAVVASSRHHAGMSRGDPSSSYRSKSS
jgi:hypothetical protein